MLHEDQVQISTSEEPSGKTKAWRTKTRKSPYLLPNSQPPNSQPRSTNTFHTSMSPNTSQPSLWYQTRNTATGFNWSSYLNHCPHAPINYQDHSPGGSTGSCYGETVADNSHENSPISREDYPPVSWKAPHQRLFSALDGSSHAGDWYKAAYGTYYHHLAATAVRTYEHMAHSNKLTDFYYSNAYSRLAGA